MSDWRQQGSCIDEDPELFHPVGDGPAARLQTVEARDVCNSCPVRTLCLEWAMAHHPQAGIWGGITEDERALERRRRQRAATEARRGTPGQKPDEMVAARRQRVGWLSRRGLRPHQIAARMGISADIVHADLARMREAA